VASKRGQQVGKSTVRDSHLSNLQQGGLASLSKQHQTGCSEFEECLDIQMHFREPEKETQ
jgi:hypothetical protein